MARPAADYRWPARADAGCAPAGAPAALRLGPTPADPRAVVALLQPLRDAAEAARALGCSGGDRLLLVVDAATPQGSVQVALRAAGQIGVQHVDLLVAGATHAPPSPAERPPADRPVFSLRAEAAAVVLEALDVGAPGPDGRGAGAARQTLACAAGCAPADPVWGQLEDALRALPDDAQLVWIVDEGQPTDRLAQAAARAGRPMAVAAGPLSPPPSPGAPPTAWPLPAGPLDTLPLALPALPEAPPMLSGPPPSTSTPSAPGLSRAQLQQGLAAVLPRLRACGAAARVAEPALQLRASPRFVVQPDGRVAGVTWTGGPPPPPALAGCVEAALKAARFPRPQGGGVVLVTFPLGADANPTGSVDSIPAARDAQ
ncbi:MAG: hypothetical protein JNM72_21805 [Deltaproteobacteria bacterium]|nr:hypothetical protein [Deltaproteobacteria bacterium]